jgi:two-component system, LytTR family, response regulator
MRFTTLIVDDEPLARAGLRMWLAADPEVSVIQEAKDGREAVAAIRNDRPDLVFLDVQMPEMDGFSVVHQVGADRMPAVVFVTAHDQHAIHAFEINAIDYLLKPVTEERFTQALTRAKTRLQSHSSTDANRQIIGLLETIVSPRRHMKRLAVRSAGKTVFVDVEEIDWIDAAENYVQLHCGKATHLLHVPMNALEKSLDPEIFLRIHRSTIVNVGRIKDIQTGVHGEYLLTLRDGVRLQSGRTYQEKLRALTANPF